MPKPQRDPLLRELALLVRAPEPNENNIGELIAGHANELADAFGIQPVRLLRMAHLPDPLVAPSVRILFDELRIKQRMTETRRAEQAARELGRKATWLDERVVLDVDIVLGDLLSDRSKKFIRFIDDSFDVSVRRSTIAECRPLRRTFMDLVSFVNAKGVSFRWRAARGRLNFLPQQVDDPERALVVALPARRLARHAWQAIGDALRDGYLT